jgi:hypothetical protein
VITEFLLVGFLAGLDAVLSLLPTFDMPEPNTYLSGFRFITKANEVVPVVTLTVCIVALFAVELAMRAWDLVVWIYHQFWGSE